VTKAAKCQHRVNIEQCAVEQWEIHDNGVTFVLTNEQIKYT